MNTPAFLSNTFFNADIVIGILFLGMGIFIRLRPPKKINSFWGYNSYASRKNQDTWNTANTYAARLSRLLAYALITIGIICGFGFDKQSEAYYYITVGSTIIAVMLFRGMTERYLYQEFDENGNRKEPVE